MADFWSDKPTPKMSNRAPKSPPRKLPQGRKPSRLLGRTTADDPTEADGQMGRCFRIKRQTFNPPTKVGHNKDL